MPTYDATEAPKHIKPEMMESFKEAIAEADREGKRLVSVIVVNGTPVIYNIQDK